MKIKIIAAMSSNRVIGKDNKLPWDIPEDLKRFRELTRGSFIIMGRKTYESIGRPLPKRTNIIVTRNYCYENKVPQSCIVFSHLEGAFALSKHHDLWIIGGSEIYEQSIDFADEIHLTVIDQKYEGDSYFPKIDENKWELVSREEGKSEKFSHKFWFLTYKRKLSRC